MYGLLLLLVSLMIGTAGCSTTDPQPDPAISFMKHQQTYGTTPTFKVALGDLDGDGDLDAHVHYYQVSGAFGRIYLNDGLGTFTLSPVTITGSASWGDLDGDGDIDLFTKVQEDGRRVFLNDGSGLFTEYWSHTDPAWPAGWKAPALGDLDGDGDLDAFDADGDQSQNHPARVWFNDSSGQFTPGEQEIGSFGALRSMLADLDSDSDLDALLIQSFGDEQVWLNDGTGSFEDSGLRFGDTEMTGEPAIGDLDGDGDLDLFVPWYGGGGPNEVWLQIQP